MKYLQYCLTRSPLHNSDKLNGCGRHVNRMSELTWIACVLQCIAVYCCDARLAHTQTSII